MIIVFSSRSHGIVVSRRSDGSLAWSGQYNGVAIRSAVVIDGGKRCVLLLDPDANLSSAFENLLCIDHMGRTVWTAKLPNEYQDVFVAIHPQKEGIWANTFSGFRILIDEHSGVELRRSFVK
jgi:hypothetical protein